MCACDSWFTQSCDSLYLKKGSKEGLFQLFPTTECPLTLALRTKSVTRRIIVPSPRIYTFDFESNAQVTTRAHNPIDKIPSTDLFALVYPRLRETRQSQVETGHFSKNIFFDGHSPSLMRSLSDGERASQTVRTGFRT